MRKLTLLLAVLVVLASTSIATAQSFTFPVGRRVTRANWYSNGQMRRFVARNGASPEFYGAMGRLGSNVVTLTPEILDFLRLLYGSPKGAATDNASALAQLTSEVTRLSERVAAMEKSAELLEKQLSAAAKKTVTQVALDEYGTARKDTLQRMVGLRDSAVQSRRLGDVFLKQLEAHPDEISASKLEPLRENIGKYDADFKRLVDSLEANALFKGATINRPDGT